MEDLKKKQDYLKSEIIDKNYDQDKFIHFLTSRKENGSHISNWSMYELLNLTNEFKSQSEEIINEKQSNSEEK